MRKQDKLTSFLLKNNKEISNEDIKYYKDNPEELDVLINKETLQIGILHYFFAIGLGLLLGGKFVGYIFKHAISDFISDVVIDSIVELGNAILGGVVAAYLLEYLQKKQYKQNVAYRREVKRRINKKSLSKKV